MGVPFEALIPYGIILGVSIPTTISRPFTKSDQMFTATGLGLATVKKYSNDGKRPRRALDAWDRVGA